MCRFGFSLIERTPAWVRDPSLRSYGVCVADFDLLQNIDPGKYGGIDASLDCAGSLALSQEHGH